MRRCAWGGDLGGTWVHAAAPSKRKARTVAARVVGNAKAARRRYGASAGITVHVVKRGAGAASPSSSRAAPARSRRF
ncbi:hypothetical protein AB0J42_04630 [Nonomuraea sp. NPDC049649]|uniref:hypothetical protein n=1 Tax=Nonomuraea sp. NPDC049649 TaxID=3155776 RepID=UPI003435B4CE